MKKKLISAAILLGASSLALANPAVESADYLGADPDKAMLLNADGLGQVLFYPYYNVNEGFDTAFTVVNTSDTYRAVKVRIFEGKNSWEVLDFNLYMSPNDTWQGMLHKHEDGKIELITADTSCTLPKLNNPKNPAYLRAVEGNITEIEGKQNRNVSLFTGNRYKTQDEREAEYADPGKLIERISEGYVEVIDMGAIWQGPGDIDTDVTDDNYQALASIIGSAAADAGALKKELKELYGKEGSIKELLNAIKHVDGVPGDCAYLDQFAHTIWEAKNPDYFIIQDDKNALSGSATLINVKKGMAGSYNAVAVKNFVMNDPAIVGVTTTTGTPPNVTTTTTYPARDYTTTAPRAYTLHNVPSSSYPNINGQVQRVHNRKGIVIYSDAINPNVLLSYNGGTYAPLTVNDALINNKTGDTYERLEKASWTAKGIPSVPANLYPAAVSLSAIMMAQDVVGEYVIDPDLRAASDWIITMPTKHYFTNPDTTRPTNISRGLGQYGFINDYIASAAVDNIDALVKDGSGKPVKPETVKGYISAFQPFSNTAFDAGNPLVEVAKIVTFNREEGESTISHEFDFSPSIGLPDTGMNSEANVLHFSKDPTKKIFTSMNEHMLGVREDFRAGWAKVSFNKQFLSNQVIDENDLGENCEGIAANNKANFCLLGLPVIGVAATKYVNSILYIDGIGDVLSNYMGIVDLTYKRNNTVK